MSKEAPERRSKSLFSLPRVLLVLLVFLMFAALWLSASPYRRFWFQQRELAGELGVRTADYSIPDTFPIGYFRAELQSGMPAADVHAIVRGYEAAYRCEEHAWEVYYYFSRDDARALRFLVAYDSDLRFEYLGTEDSGQRTISVDGCAPGRLGN